METEPRSEASYEELATKRQREQPEAVYPSLKDLLGSEFCERMFSEESEDWESLRLSPEEFIRRVESHPSKRELWEELLKLCFKVLHTPQDEGSVLPSGKFFLWGSLEDQWLSKVWKYACEKA